jgi:hypothetical protein
MVELFFATEMSSLTDHLIAIQLRLLQVSRTWCAHSCSCGIKTTHVRQKKMNEHDAGERGCCGRCCCHSEMLAFVYDNARKAFAWLTEIKDMIQAAAELARS